MANVDLGQGRQALHLRGARIVTMNQRREVVTGDLTIVDGVITGVGGTLPTPPGATVIDASTWTLIPGLVQTHIHLCQTLFRGLADDLLLLDWLKERIWPLEGAHDPESLTLSVQLGIGELLRTGTTTIVDMETVHHTEHAFRAIEHSGIRAVAGKVMMDVGGGVPETLLEDTDASLRESIALLERWHGADGGRIRYAFSPRFAISCTDDLLRKVKQASDHYEVLVHTHASENQDEIALVEQDRGFRNIAYFDHLAMTGPRLLLAHCVWVDEAEIQILADTGTRVLHCPSSNLKLGSGFARIPELLAKGVEVSIGADGAPCNNNLDGFHEMRLASLIQKPIFGPTAMPAALTFELATLGGARAIGQEDLIGSLEVGKRADVVAVDLNGLHALPGTQTNVYSQLVYAAQPSDVQMTIVDGRVLYQEGRLLTIDQDDLRRRLPRVLQKLLDRAGVSEVPQGLGDVAMT